METGSEPPSAREAREAREALVLASDGEDAVRYPPLPRWFFTTQAALMAALFLAQLLPSPDSSSQASFALAVAAVVLAATQWLNRPGVSWVQVRVRDLVPFTVALLGIFLGCLVVIETTSAWWVWIIGAVASATVVLRTGRAYGQAFRGGA